MQPIAKVSAIHFNPIAKTIAYMLYLNQKRWCNFMYYIIITNSVYADKDINDGAKLLYGLILSLSQKDGYCYAPNEYLADALNKSKRMIGYYLDELKQKQVIAIEILKNNSRRITTQDTRVRLTPIAKTPLESKFKANKSVLVAPQWINEWYEELKAWQENQ